MPDFKPTAAETIGMLASQKKRGEPQIGFPKELKLRRQKHSSDDNVIPPEEDPLNTPKGIVIAALIAVVFFWVPLLTVLYVMLFQGK